MTKNSTSSPMTEGEEAAYLLGEKAAARRFLGECLSMLDQDDAKVARLVKERADVVAILRRICRDHGDNEWEDSTYLADVLDKHLGRHLDEVERHLERDLDELQCDE